MARLEDLVESHDTGRVFAGLQDGHLVQDLALDVLGVTALAQELGGVLAARLSTATSTHGCVLAPENIEFIVTIKINLRSNTGCSKRKGI